MFRLNQSKIEYVKNVERMKQIYIQKSEERKTLFQKMTNYHTYIDSISRSLFQKQQELLLQKSHARSLRMDPC